MPNQLTISAGQHSDKGRKPLNQDFHALMTPRAPVLNTKGIALALADGISSSDVSQQASEASVTGFLEDYYSTSETWSVRTAAQKVLQATNSWLYNQNRNSAYRYTIEKGYVCTLSAMVLKSNTAHIFHAGDSRVYRVNGDSLEQITEDHRVWMSAEKSYLSRAIGMRERLDIDYHTCPIAAGDIFMLTTDGVNEFTEPKLVTQILAQHVHDLDAAALRIVQAALDNGSDDNLTVQLVRVEQVPEGEIDELSEQAAALPFPPDLAPGASFDGYRIVRELHHSHRSHVYLAVDEDSDKQVALKTPSVDKRDENAYLESFLMEEWIARRVRNVHLQQAHTTERPRNYLYTVTEYIDGQSLQQWMTDNPKPDLERVRGIVEQIAKGLQALHRQEMLHQDLRPQNILIDKSGTVKIIDFGAARVAGVTELHSAAARQPVQGTLQYTAPEYFLGEPGRNQSDLFSLAVITYQMLSGRQPYGTRVARATTAAAQLKLVYKSVLSPERAIPRWVDQTLRKALQPNPLKRYDTLSEFTFDLRTPNPAYLKQAQAPLIERNPLAFWKGLSLILFVAVLLLAGSHPLLID